MRKLGLWASALMLGAVAAMAHADQPQQVSGDYLKRSGARPMFEKLSLLTDEDLAALRNASTVTVPHFSGKFSYEGKTHRYTIAGGAPQDGGTTTIPTAIVPLRLVFEGYTDANGRTIVLDGSSHVADVSRSPNFATANYSVGNHLQVADAVQIAQFYSVRRASWHTKLGKPRVLKPLTIRVPKRAAQVTQAADGSYSATMNYFFFAPKLLNAVAKSGVAPTELAIFLVDNVYMYEGSTDLCCVLGFHIAIPVTTSTQARATQTLAYATWVPPGVFSNADIADVLPLSHEISEFVNDPFINNWVPAWQYPDGSHCGPNLETGDPIEVLDHPAYPVTIGSTTYHPQTEALLQWFTRTAPSDAFSGAYSYPDMTALTAPAQDCR
jgi:hypothetical protein